MKIQCIVGIFLSDGLDKGIAGNYPDLTAFQTTSK